MDARGSAPEILPSFDLWVGCYTADGDGSGRGVGAAHVTNGVPAWSHLAAPADSPSFLARHPTYPVLYAVGEMAETIRAFHIDAPGRLSPLGQTRAAGAACCHVAVAPGGRFAVACCWGDGQVLCYPLADDGALLPGLPAAPAVDPHEATARAAGGPARVSRAHCALMLGDGRVVTTDLGYDLVRVWRYEPGHGLTPDHEVVLPLRSEPRHLVQHPSGRILIVGEASLKIFVLAPGDDGRYSLESTSPVLPDTQPGDTASEISLDASGRFALVAVRGQNTIATLAVSADGATITPTSSAACGGVTPRHHLQIGPLLLVANQGSDSITAFRLNRHTGTIAEQIADITVGAPSCLLTA